MFSKFKLVLVSIFLIVSDKAVSSVEAGSSRSDLSIEQHRVRGLLNSREVLVALPKGKAPVSGWPTVIFYQGSYFKTSFFWPRSAPLGGQYESQTLVGLVKSGFAVVVPRARYGVAWETNLLTSSVRGVGTVYEDTDDYTFLTNLFASIESGDLGPLDAKKKLAAGMSSGGYNASRMALSFPGEFRALMIHSASYATFLGPNTPKMPTELSKGHPPTLFLHGGDDLVVPVSTMFQYYNKLKNEGFEAEFFVKESAGHSYFEETPKLTMDWFSRFK